MQKTITIWLSIILAFLLLGCDNLPNSPTIPDDDNTYDGVFPEHDPIGKGVGIMPGRVVWQHDPNTVNWNGDGYWWELDHFDSVSVQKMVNESIAKLANKNDIKAGWQEIFVYHNKSHNNKNSGYTPGEKIAIKANINGSGVNNDDATGQTNMSYTNPVLLKALLMSLVNDANVAPSDIYVYDVSRIFPTYMIELCTEGVLMGVNFVGRNNAQADENVPIVWSKSFNGDYVINNLPTVVTEADYLINLANLKGHSYGITLSAKNHFGSFLNNNTMRPPEGAGLHQFLTRNEMDAYTVLVDLMANHQLGQKTILYMLDALICAPSEGSSITSANSKWQLAPFNNDYPSSLLVSLDPVAIDSVGADFLINEPTVINNNSSLKNNPNVENYLHEASLLSNSKSNTIYYNGSDEVVTNLGVHEHWNNNTDKLYSRNLGKGEGIELVYNQTTTNNSVSAKKAIVYFSHSGNTKKLAEKINEQVEADLIALTSKNPYPNVYNDILNQAQIEKTNNARPELSIYPNDIEDYDIIFLGYPIWWGDVPMLILTFLEHYDFTGKTIIPFCTYGSSGFGNSLSSIKSAAKGANIIEGFGTAGSAVESADAKIMEWLGEIRMLDNSTTNQLKLTINNYSFDVTLANTVASQELVTMLPMAITMSDLNSNEKYAYLTQNLTTSATTPHNINAGDVMLFGNTCLVIFYESFTSSYSYTRIGKIDNIDNLKKALSSDKANVLIDN